MENKTELFEKIKKELTAKELEVLTSLLMGENLKETSCSCGISVAVAANHRAKVYEKCSDLGLILTNKKTKQADLIEQLKGMLEFLTPDKPAEKEKEETREDKLQKEIDRLVELYKPLRDDYFKGLTIAQIAELAKKSNRLAEENRNLEDFIETQAQTFGEPVDTLEEAFKVLEEEIAKAIKFEFDSNSNEIEGIKKEEPQEDASREHGNFLVLNPKKNAPNRIYKYFASAETAAKQVAKKEQETTYVLRIEKMIVPETSFYVHDFKNRIIAEDYLTQKIPF